MKKLFFFICFFVLLGLNHQSVNVSAQGFLYEEDNYTVNQEVSW